MAYVTGFFSAERRGLKDRVAGLSKAFAHAAAERRAYRQTYNELSRLSDRELTDLGLSAAQIPFIAREAARNVT